MKTGIAAMLVLAVVMTLLASQMKVQDRSIRHGCIAVILRHPPPAQWLQTLHAMAHEPLICKLAERTYTKHRSDYP